MSDVWMVGCDLYELTLMLKSCVGKDGVVAARTVPRSELYSWRNRPPSTMAARRTALAQEVREVHHLSRENYGAVRAHRAFGQRGTKSDRKTVRKVMREAGLRSPVA